jgi:hypothetical protein
MNCWRCEEIAEGYIIKDIFDMHIKLFAMARFIY